MFTAKGWGVAVLITGVQIALVAGLAYRTYQTIAPGWFVRVAVGIAMGTIVAWRLVCQFLPDETKSIYVK